MFLQLFGGERPGGWMPLLICQCLGGVQDSKSGGQGLHKARPACIRYAELASYQNTAQVALAFNPTDMTLILHSNSVTFTPTFSHVTVVL